MSRRVGDALTGAVRCFACKPTWPCASRPHNRVGLQTALRAILKETGGYRAERDIDDVLRIGDAATGTRVLQELYQANRAAPVTPDLAQLWERLGVPADPIITALR